MCSWAQLKVLPFLFEFSVDCWLRDFMKRYARFLISFLRNSCVSLHTVHLVVLEWTSRTFRDYMLLSINSIYFHCRCCSFNFYFRLFFTLMRAIWSSKSFCLWFCYFISFCNLIKKMLKNAANVCLLAALWFFKTFFKDASLPNVYLLDFLPRF